MKLRDDKLWLALSYTLKSDELSLNNYAIGDFVENALCKNAMTAIHGFQRNPSRKTSPTWPNSKAKGDGNVAL